MTGRIIRLVDHEQIGAISAEDGADYTFHSSALSHGTFKDLVLGTPVSFEPAAIDRISRFTGGVPRVINLLCDRALMLSAADRLHAITPDIIDRAAAVLELKPAPEPVVDRQPRRIPRWWRWGRGRAPSSLRRISSTRWC